MLKTNKLITFIAIIVITLSIFTTTFCTEEILPTTEVPIETPVTEPATEIPVETEESVQIEEQTEIKIIHVKAKVVSVGEVYEEQIDNMTNKVQNIKVKILSGEHKDKAYDSEFILSQDIDNKIMAYELKKGDTVFVELVEEAGEVKSVVTQDFVRESSMLYILLIFIVLVFIVGGFKGIRSIISLAITILIIYFVTVKWILSGGNPILVSIITSAITIVITFAIVSGINKKTITATLGTIGGIAFSGVMAIIFGNLAKLSGFQEEAVFLSINAQNMVFNFREILYAGIIISSLGACMDVGMSIASSLDEIKKQKLNVTSKELMKSGIDIGRDVIGTMTNTLILAYVGSSLNLILMFMAANIPFEDIINKEMIVAELVSAISASMGVVFTIPITTFIYTVINNKKNKYKTKPSTRIAGERTIKI